MKNLNFKKFLPHVIAVAVFLLLTVTYFSPVIFDNKTLQQGDMQGFEGMVNEVKQYQKETGEYSMWTNSMFGGMPTTTFYGEPSFNVFGKVLQICKLGLPDHTAAILFLSMLGFYVMLICFGVTPWLAVVGAVGYAFGSYNLIIIEAGHITKAYAMAMIAPVFGGLIRTFKGHYFSGLLVTLLALGGMIVSNHVQITYYTMLSVIIIGVVYLIYSLKEKTIKKYLLSLALLIGVAVLAIFPSTVFLFPNLEYSKDTMRGGAVLSAKEGQKESSGLDIGYAYSWSYSKGETLTFMIPDAYGGGMSDHSMMEKAENRIATLRSTGAQLPDTFINQYISASYWGNQPFTSGPVYFGAIICFLFVLGLIIVKGPEKWWILAVTLLSVMMSWGKNMLWFNEFLFYYLPKYNIFRTPSMSLVIANVTMVLMAVLALKTLFEQKIDTAKAKRYLYISGGIAGGICLLLALIPTTFFDFTTINDESLQKQFGQIFSSQMQDALIADRIAMLTADAWRSLLFIAIAFGTLWLFINNKLKQVNYVIAILGIAILIDLWQVDKRYLNEKNFMPKKAAGKIMPTAANQFILQDTDPDYRVLNLASNTFNESQTSYFHKSVGGYSPVKMRRYQDLIDHHISKEINYFVQNLRQIASTADISPILDNCNVLNMLNTRYIIYNDGVAPIKNSHALGNAWFVKDIKWVNTPDEEIEALNSIHPALQIVINKEYQTIVGDFAPTFDSTARIILTKYAPNKVEYRSTSATSQMAVFSEIYYDKGWKAYIDGVEAPHFRSNYILRAMVVPAGEHLIMFKFYPKTYYLWKNISVWTSIVVLILIVGGIVWYNKKQKENIKSK